MTRKERNKMITKGKRERFFLIKKNNLQYIPAHHSLHIRERKLCSSQSRTKSRQLSPKMIVFINFALVETPAVHFIQMLIGISMVHSAGLDPNGQRQDVPECLCTIQQETKLLRYNSLPWFKCEIACLCFEVDRVC